MKKVLILILTVCQAITIAAQKKNPKWVDKADKAIFTIETTTKEGTTKSGPGFFIQENGEAVSSYDLFRKAEKAIVITSGGERLQVTQILGADDMYSVIRFKVSVPKKTIFLPVAKVLPAMNSVAYLPPSKEEKNLTQGAISEITKINGAYDYYKIDMPLPKSQEGYPLLNEAGEVFALTQVDASGKGKTFGISVAYIQSLHATATDMLKRTYSEIGIRKAWASNIEEAQISLLLYSSQQDAKTYLETLSDFIATFPNSPDGYNSRASHYAFHRKELASAENEQLQMLDMAWNDLESAAKYTKNKGDIYYNKAKLIFGTVASDSMLQYKDWNMETAKANIQKAIAEEDLPVYRQLEGDIAFYEKDFEKAYNSYSTVNNSPAASGSSYYLAAKSKQQIGGSNIMEIISLMDSATAKSPVNEAAVYLLENVDLKMQAGLYDQVVKDYDMYYLMAGGNVSDEFYYYREQAKFRSGNFEGALEDINKAISINGTNAIFYAEKASVYLRLKDLPKAQECAEKAIEIAPDFASAYRILGVSLVRQDKKTEACTHFNKAKELGDPVVEKLIKENCN
ncbi:MAG: tetratricopeptide repeat protein [Tannerella sp.]|jgi:tetratricopeptide (TPR) repeat protein|nr:tetratricopeptide repeat protein [Tannerella sp.]